MTFETEVAEAFNSIVPSYPLYRLVKDPNRDAINIKSLGTGTPGFTKRNFITDLFKRQIIETINISRKCNVVQLRYVTSPEELVWNSVCYWVKEFLRENIKSQKPGNTKIFRWYRVYITSFTSETGHLYKDFKEDVWQLYKYIKDRDDNPSEIDFRNAVGLLHLIKDRYEKQGVRL